ncbi:phosphatidylinositol N-acetylglucosaminyltransferase subunit P [Aplysia californica]|uniref:Phosphatidylinositol N-acetylglucosaminyltransferase subunit P n=1 Tax=Aplysia californica TaxID=6500 RepID=A0ABM0JA91_APLCA|nr:phosphatidylinositol N-acetylglucosaminyltransferase subunit P [Aplysia californica]
MAQEHSPSPTPERAVYGFVFYLASFVGFVVYIVWAYVPDAWLHSVGLTYWPQKYWAVAVPTYFCVAVILAFIAYTGLIFLKTAPITDGRTITDSKAIIYDSHVELQPNALPPLRDLDISTVNRILYSTDATCS